ncbi:hypothetical protein [Ferroplasma sp.]|uniref:hypothetical protein n=1 Tax=Ferroplasma sp. TaxID=2591003 RepID=UPI00307EC03D
MNYYYTISDILAGISKPYLDKIIELVVPNIERAPGDEKKLMDVLPEVLEARVMSYGSASEDTPKLSDDASKIMEKVVMFDGKMPVTREYIDNTPGIKECIDQLALFVIPDMDCPEFLAIPIEILASQWISDNFAKFNTFTLYGYYNEKELIRLASKNGMDLTLNHYDLIINLSEKFASNTCNVYNNLPENGRIIMDYILESGGFIKPSKLFDEFPVSKSGQNNYLFKLQNLYRYLSENGKSLQNLLNNGLIIAMFTHNISDIVFFAVPDEFYSLCNRVDKHRKKNKELAGVKMPPANFALDITVRKVFEALDQMFRHRQRRTAQEIAIFLGINMDYLESILFYMAREKWITRKIVNFDPLPQGYNLLNETKIDNMIKNGIYDSIFECRDKKNRILCRLEEVLTEFTLKTLAQKDTPEYIKNILPEIYGGTECFKIIRALKFNYMVREDPDSREFRKKVMEFSASYYNVPYVIMYYLIDLGLLTTSSPNLTPETVVYRDDALEYFIKFHELKNV